MNKPIVNVSNDTWQNARRGVWTCPFCDYNAPNDDWAIWERNATKLVLEPRIYKRNHVVVFSECPKCFEQSWLHYSMSMFSWGYEEFPKKWRTTVSKLYKELKINEKDKK